ncbi:MAG: TonB-dependent receptor [Bacteroidetes bacterium]|nr:MAG: TonB-dependent receptor [Bacteroidota bacterium]
MPFRCALIIPLLFLVSAASAQAQKGKIAGTVRDDRSGDPLPGVNIVVDGTRLGGVSDLDGNYFILNIPPGRYTVSATLLGYAKVTQTGTEVSIDRTTPLDFRLRESTVEFSEVVVVAQKPKVVKDQTSTSQTIDDTQIRSAPIEGTRGALDLSAGFQKSATGNYTVRGSGSYEVNFQINGVDQVNVSTSSPGSFGSDKANNSWKYDVNPIAVQQMQLITGGFAAEYGNAQAGVVKLVTKEGTPAFSGEVRYEYRPPGQYHFHDYLYDQSNYEWQKWGAYENWWAKRNDLLKELRLDQRYPYNYAEYQKSLGVPSAHDTAAARNFAALMEQELRWAHSMWVKNHTPSDDNPFGVYDYRQYSYNRLLFGFGGPLGGDPDILKFYLSGEYRANPTRLPTPEKVQVFQNYIGSITYLPAANHKVKLMAMYQRYRGGIWSGSDDIRWSGIAFSPPGTSTKYYVAVDPVRTEQTTTQSLNWVYTIDQRSFLEATVSHQFEKYELPYEFLYGYEQSADRLDSLNDADGGVVLRDGQWWEKDYYRAPFNFSTNYFQDNRTDHWNASVDFTRQLDNGNLLKAGARFYYWDMVNTGVNSNFLANAYVTRTGFAEHYRAYPYNTSLYIQDKMEYSGMVANLGVRFEMYNFQTPVPVDIFNPFYIGESGSGIRGNPETTGSDIHYIVLPRLGLSFPIGENTAFRLQYGHFASMPIFSQALSQRTESGWTGRGNPDLSHKKTINYEFGIQQMLDEAHRLDLSLYYNDRVRQIGLQRVAAYSGSINRPAGSTNDQTPLYLYTTYANNAYGSTIGLETTFERVGLGRWGYRVSYSLSQTSEGNYGEQTLYPDDISTARREYVGSYLSGNDRTHNLRALVSYTLRDGEGMRILNTAPFQNTTISVTYTLQSGAPFTYRTDFDLKDIVNNRRYPLETLFDLSAQRTLVVGDYSVLIGLRIMNLFNNKHLTPMDVTQDITDWVERGITIEDPGLDPTRLSYRVAPYRAYRNLPRQVYLTVGFGF